MTFDLGPNQPAQVPSRTADGTIFIVWLPVILCVLRMALLCGFYPAMLASLDILAIQEGGREERENQQEL